MCYYVINLIPEFLFSPLFISLDLYLGVRNRVWWHYQHLAHVRICPSAVVGVESLTLSPSGVLWGIQAGLSQREMLLQGVCSLLRDSRCGWLALVWV